MRNVIIIALLEKRSFEQDFRIFTTKNVFFDPHYKETIQTLFLYNVNISVTAIN